ncbi:ferredoxin [Halalkaliarchaeum desulfuricum]|uniref:Ferredoxin n=1 Tax=Halalkaliarchaeum desulfuricum TaxID=2055893 RepID=A0A343TMP5_9EURY|nr:2Fe-2S iron-sulfur cluster-binding protein [Halalkaliarchaeum desulfuricum]AUX10367.1 ferredoxin [Halalkaliarchaeum desulfuricum]
MSSDDHERQRPDDTSTSEGCDGGDCPRTKRRLLLKSAAAGGTVALAGCLGMFEVPEEKRYVGRSDPPDAEPDPDPDPDEDEEPDEDEDPDEAQAFDVNFLRDETVVNISEDQDLLNAGEEAGLDLPYQCRTGVCGVCKAKTNRDATEVQEMDGNQYLDDEEIAEGYLLTCVSYPRADFPVDTHPDEGDDIWDDVDDDEDDATHAVEFQNNAATLDISEDETLLDAGLEEGLDLPYQCEVGVCGVCKAKTDGDANEVQEMDGNQYLDDDEIEDGYLLTCVSYPRADFSIDENP